MYGLEKMKMSKYKYSREQIADAETEVARTLAVLAGRETDPYKRGVLHGYHDAIKGYLNGLQEKR